jgi:uncharacterized cupredoxin-like copper-binding protein
MSVAFVMLTLAATASAQRERTTATTIQVTAFEFGFTLSAKSARIGTVTFVIKNTGLSAHDFWINGKRSPLIQPDQTGKLTVKFTKTGRYRYHCTVAGHAWSGMRGIFTIR